MLRNPIQTAWRWLLKLYTVLLLPHGTQTRFNIDLLFRTIFGIYYLPLLLFTILIGTNVALQFVYVSVIPTVQNLPLLQLSSSSPKSTAAAASIAAEEIPTTTTQHSEHSNNPTATSTAAALLLSQLVRIVVSHGFFWMSEIFTALLPHATLFFCVMAFFHKIVSSTAEAAVDTMSHYRGCDYPLLFSYFKVVLISPKRRVLTVSVMFGVFYLLWRFAQQFVINVIVTRPTSVIAAVAANISWCVAYLAATFASAWWREQQRQKHINSSSRTSRNKSGGDDEGDNNNLKKATTADSDDTMASSSTRRKSSPDPVKPDDGDDDSYDSDATTSHHHHHHYRDSSNCFLDETVPLLDTSSAAASRNSSTLLLYTRSHSEELAANLFALSASSTSTAHHHHQYDSNDILHTPGWITNWWRAHVNTLRHLSMIQLGMFLFFWVLSDGPIVAFRYSVESLIALNVPNFWIFLTLKVVLAIIRFYNSFGWLMRQKEKLSSSLSLSPTTTTATSNNDKGHEQQQPKEHSRSKNTSASPSKGKKVPTPSPSPYYWFWVVSLLAAPYLILVIYTATLVSSAGLILWTLGWAAIMIVARCVLLCREHDVSAKGGSVAWYTVLAQQQPHHPQHHHDDDDEHQPQQQKDSKKKGKQQTSTTTTNRRNNKSRLSPSIAALLEHAFECGSSSTTETISLEIEADLTQMKMIQQGTLYNLVREEAVDRKMDVFETWKELAPRLILFQSSASFSGSRFQLARTVVRAMTHSLLLVFVFLVVCLVAQESMELLRPLPVQLRCLDDLANGSNGKSTNSSTTTTRLCSRLQFDHLVTQLQLEVEDENEKHSDHQQQNNNVKKQADGDGDDEGRDIGGPLCTTEALPGLHVWELAWLSLVPYLNTFADVKTLLKTINRGLDSDWVVVPFVSRKRKDISSNKHYSTSSPKNDDREAATKEDDDEDDDEVYMGTSRRPRQPWRAFIRFRSHARNVTVVAIRGTDMTSVLDALQDVDMYLGTAVFHVLSHLVPGLGLLPKPIIRDLIHLSADVWPQEEGACLERGCVRDTAVSEERRYYDILLRFLNDEKHDTEQCSEEFSSSKQNSSSFLDAAADLLRSSSATKSSKQDHNKVIFTGHSIAGALAHIVASRSGGDRSIGFNSPGVNLPLKKFEIPSEDTVRRIATTIVSENDIVPNIGGQVGHVVQSACRDEVKERCHSMESIVASMWHLCPVSVKKRFPKVKKVRLN